MNKCAWCIRHGQAERSYSHHPMDNRLIDFLWAEDLPFHTISIDWLSEIWCKAHNRARGKSNHSVSVLVIVDLATGGICFSIAADSTSVSVIKALKCAGLRYRFPKRIVTDAGSFLVNLSNHPELMNELTHLAVELIPLPASHQFSNWSERQI